MRQIEWPVGDMLAETRASEAIADYCMERIGLTRFDDVTNIQIAALNAVVAAVCGSGAPCISVGADVVTMGKDATSEVVPLTEAEVSSASASSSLSAASSSGAASALETTEAEEARRRRHDENVTRLAAYVVEKWKPSA
jgi:hypothetical protein